MGHARHALSQIFPLKKPFIKTLQISTALYQDKTCKRDIIFTNSRKDKLIEIHAE